MVDREMNIAACMCLKSVNGIEAYYVSMALKSLIPYVQGIYVQDQGSMDNTIEVVRETVYNTLPRRQLVIEEEPNPFPPFSLDYNEPRYRNKSVQRCEEVFNSDWIIQCDADDIFTPHLFETVQAAETSGVLANCNGVFYSSDRFISPQYKSGWRGDLTEWGGKLWTDPHYKFWRTRLRLRYPEIEAGHFHNVPITDCNPCFGVEGIANIHLHRMFGPKAWNFWRSDGDVFEETKPFNPRKQAPKLWSAPINMGSAIKVDYPWPDFILNKWAEWGDLNEDRTDYK
jgi:glycosyltransferase involved in cell wall biosynthesis